MVVSQKGSNLQRKDSRGMIVRQRSGLILRLAFARMAFFIRAALLGDNFGSGFGPKPRRLDGVYPENLANGASYFLFSLPTSSLFFLVYLWVWAPYPNFAFYSPTLLMGGVFLLLSRYSRIDSAV